MYIITYIGVFSDWYVSAIYPFIFVSPGVASIPFNSLCHLGQLGYGYILALTGPVSGIYP